MNQHLLEDIVIVSAVRTPVGKFQGTLSDLKATQLGAIAVREAVKRAGLNAGQPGSDPAYTEIGRAHV